MEKVKIIDLSYTFKSDMLVFPGNERPVFQWIKRINSEGINATKFSMFTHTGTHVDAPKHFLDDVQCIDEVSLNRLFGKTCIFRYNKKLYGQEITLEEVISSGFEMKENHIFIMETGIWKYAETKQYNEIFPSPSKELVDWLISKNVKSFMTDATAVDLYKDKSNPRHQQLLGAGIPIVENLKNLHLLPEKEDFWVSALPLKLQGRDGSPCRAIAILNFSSDDYV